MRATYACGELSATSSSTSISFTTAAPNSAWSSATRMMPVASLAGPDHSIITEMPAVSRRRRSTWACTRGHWPSSTRPLSSSSSRNAGCSATSATRQSAHCVAVGWYSAPHDGHHNVASATIVSSFGRDAERAKDARSVGRPGRYDVEVSAPVKAPSFYVETLGCPKNAVDSDKVVASLLADGLVALRTRPTPTSSSSTRARSSRRLARSRSTWRSRSPTPSAPMPSS